jgi:hypothetical protein
MWFSRLFGKRKEKKQPEEQSPKRDPINQGIHYIYIIMGLQVVFVFAILAVIMFIGKVISTPGWVFLFIFALFATSLYYIYKKAKRQFHKLRESFTHSDLSNRNYEISFMGGMLPMRIEQNANSGKLLEAPPQQPAEPIIDAETIEPAEDHKSVHLA